MSVTHQQITWTKENSCCNLDFNHLKLVNEIKLMLVKKFWQRLNVYPMCRTISISTSIIYKHQVSGAKQKERSCPLDKAEAASCNLGPIMCRFDEPLEARFFNQSNTYRYNIMWTVRPINTTFQQTICSQSHYILITKLPDV